MAHRAVVQEQEVSVKHPCSLHQILVAVWVWQPWRYGDRLAQREEYRADDHQASQHGEARENFNNRSCHLLAQPGRNTMKRQLALSGFALPQQLRLFDFRAMVGYFGM